MRERNEDEEFDPFDVLLEEALGGAAALDGPAPGTSRGAHAWWLGAALLLLGVGVVVGVLLVQSERHEKRAAREGGGRHTDSGQDAAAPRVRRPQDVDELRRLLGTLVEVRASCTAHALGLAKPLPREVGVTSADAAVGTHVIDDAILVAAWRSALTASLREPQAGPAGAPTLELTLVLEDGSGAKVSATLVGTPAISFVSTAGKEPEARRQSGAFPVTAELERLLRDAYRRTQQRLRAAHGVAGSLEELRELPAGTRRVRCPCLTPPQARAELPRFHALEHLELVAQGLSQLPGAEVVDVLTRLETLVSLSLPARALTDAEVTRLRVLPRLVALELRDAFPPGALTGKTLSELPHLRALSLVRCPLTADGYRALARAPALQELHLEAGVDAASSPMGALAILPSLPHLVRLRLTGGAFGDTGNLAALAQTKLEALSLAHTACTQEGLAHLAHLASLRALSLRDTQLGAGSSASLAALTQLTRLDLTGTSLAAARADLQRALPGCTIVDGPAAPVGTFFQVLTGFF